MKERVAGDPEELIYVDVPEDAAPEEELVKVDPELAREAGFCWPVCISQRVARLVTPTLVEERQGHSVQRRLWDMLWLARIALLDARPEERCVAFDVMFSRRSTRLWSCVDATSGLAIHIITPEESWRRGGVPGAIITREPSWVLGTVSHL